MFCAPRRVTRISLIHQPGRCLPRAVFSQAFFFPRPRAANFVLGGSVPLSSLVPSSGNAWISSPLFLLKLLFFISIALKTIFFSCPASWFIHSPFYVLTDGSLGRPVLPPTFSRFEPSSSLRFAFFMRDTPFFSPQGGTQNTAPFFVRVVRFDLV